jgi:hypothetical protein
MLSSIAIEEKIASAQDDLARLQKVANTAYLVAEDSSDTSARDKATAARDDLVDAQVRISALSGALLEARELEAAKVTAKQGKQDAEMWREVDKIAKQRQVVGVEIDTLILRLREEYNTLLQLGRDLYDVAPIRGGKFLNSPLAPSTLEGALRLYMVKQSFDWAASYPWDKAKINAFSDHVSGGNAVVLSSKPAKKAA